MMISNIIEAQEATAALADFWTRFNAMTGVTMMPAKVIQSNTPAAPAPRSIAGFQPGVLSEMQARVIQALTEAGRPLKEKGLVQEFQRREWPVANPAKIGTILYSCASNLVKKGKISKGPDGFSAGGQLQLPVQRQPANLPAQ